MTIDRSSPPIPSARKGFRFPAFEHSYLPNGLSIYACRMPEFPLVCLEMIALAGAEHDPAELRGLATFQAELLAGGTARRDATAIAREVELLGGGLVTNAGWNAASAEIVTLSEELPKALEILADCWLHPTFPPSEVERVREEIATGLLHRRALPAQLADDLFAREVYGDSAYGRPVAGTPEGIAAITREDLVRFQERYLRPRASALAVVGDFDPQVLARQVEGLFGGWADQPPILAPEIVPRTRHGLEIHLVDRPSSRQAQLQVGRALVPRRHEDFPALIVANLVLGGKFTSRINLNLRERHGFTYGANSVVVQRRGPGPFYVRTAVSSENAGAALSEILFEIDRIRREPIPETELRFGQDYLIGVFPSTVQTSHDVLQRLEALFLHAFPDDHFTRFPELLGDYGPDELLRVADKYLDPATMVAAVVGSADELLPQLEKVGKVTVHAA